MEDECVTRGRYDVDVQRGGWRVGRCYCRIVVGVVFNNLFVDLLRINLRRRVFNHLPGRTLYYPQGIAWCVHV